MLHIIVAFVKNWDLTPYIVLILDKIFDVNLLEWNFSSEENILECKELTKKLFKTLITRNSLNNNQI